MTNEYGFKKRLLIARSMTVDDVAQQLGCSSSEIILYLLRQGIVCSKNKVLPENLIKELARHYGVEFEVKQEERKVEAVLAPEELATIKRAPVVVVVGHVDHGKTSLLDYIRKTRVAQREKGGITQHLGAYKVTGKYGDIVFLDTPGHEAFMFMRARGVKVADIAVLVVAADDGVMPQTIEAIRHAHDAKVPLIVAINKIDKVETKRIDEVKAQLARHGVTVENWGGDVICMPLSAKTGQGVEVLIDTIPVFADLLDLRARVTGAGVGYVLESKIEKGRGAVATVLLQHGVVHIGDYVATATVVGRVNALIDSSGKLLVDVGPVTPVVMAGFDELPQAGEIIKVISFEEYKSARFSEKQHIGEPSASDLREGALKILLKVDTNSSKEALLIAIEKLAKQERCDIDIVQVGIGTITESDIDFAVNTQAIIYGFCIKPEIHVQAYAKRMHIPIRSFYVIYHLLDDLMALIEKQHRPEAVEKKIGEAIVRKVFNIKGLVIAGCYIKTGRIVRGCKAVIWRDGKKMGEGVVETLQREKRAVKEVSAGFECGFVIEGFSAFCEEDRVECFIKEVPAE